MYMLCVSKCTLSGGCQRSMIKLSNACPCLLKYVRQKVGGIDNWYLLIVNVLEVFDSNMWWWYWKFINMGIISMTFLGRPSSSMFCNFMFFSMKSLKLTKTFMGGCIVMSFYIHSEFARDIFFMYPMLPFTILNLGYKFSIIMIFIPLYTLKKGVKHWVLLVDIVCLMMYVTMM